MNWYYKITYNTSVKYVKSTSDSCEVWLKSEFGNKYEKFNRAYPIWDEDPDHVTQLTEQEYLTAVGTIDLNFRATSPRNQRVFFKTSNSAL